jgi:hypothetical protein
MKKPYYLSIGSVIKDEQKFLKEWIEYHLFIGVERFFILDNSTHDECYKILEPYIISGKVYYQRWVDKILPQKEGFNHLIRWVYDETTWLALIDPDEFIFLKENETTPNLPEFLTAFEKDSQVAALAISWMNFGSSGRTYDTESTLTLYQRSEESNHINRKVKCIIRPDRTIESCGSHYNIYHSEYVAVNENFEIMPSGLDGPKSWLPKKHTSNFIRLNHYPIRSLQNWHDKMKRGYVDAAEKPNEINWGLYKKKFDHNDIFDDSMKPIYEQIQNRF